MKKKKVKTVIMEPLWRQGAWLHGVDEQGFQVKVPVGIRGEDMGNGFKKYRYV